MASFSSYQDINMSHFLVDSVYLKIMSEDGNKTMNSNGLSQIDPHQGEPIIQHTNPCLDHHSSDDKESSMTRKQSSESSTVVDKFESGEQVTQKLISPIGRKRKTRNGSGSGSSSNSVQSKDARVGKGKNQKQCNGEDKEKKQKQKPEHQEPPSGYIHVRARRGQATDSHSLAERVRREKISERMKVLQRLVPGCDKVTGKALMLDQIINYVQSLQNQVEFLSMKIASVDTMSFDFSLVEDSFTIFSPEERLISMHTSPLPHCSPNQLTPPAATIWPNSYDNPVDTSAFSQERYFQDNANLLWAVVEQGQEFLNPSGFNDNVSSFN